MSQGNEIKCFLCGNAANNSWGSDFNPLNTKMYISCNICGIIKCLDVFYRHYAQFTKTGLLELHSQNRVFNENENQKARLALSFFFKSVLDENKILTTDNFEEIINSVSYPAGLLVKRDLILEYLYKKSEFYHQEIYVNMTDYRLFFCLNQKELFNILNDLNIEKFILVEESELNKIKGIIKDKDRSDRLYGNTMPITDIDYPIKIKLLNNGIKYIEESGKNPKSTQCFVATWFNNDEPNMQKIYSDIIKPAIEDGSGYEAMKIDNKEHINYITDEIIKEIRRSKFMIADLTGSRGGVYYEAGFAFGLGIPVIFTCNKKWENKVHFDIKQKNMIFWEEDKFEEFKRALINRIGAVIGLNN